MPIYQIIPEIIQELSLAMLLKIKFSNFTLPSLTKVKYMTILLILIKKSSIIGLKKSLNSNMILKYHTSIFSYLQVILLDINIFLTSWLELKKMSWSLVKQVLVNQLLWEII